MERIAVGRPRPVGVDCPRHVAVNRPRCAVVNRPPCPHCGSGQVHRNGSFRLKDGTRQQRFLCRGCGRTFCQYTGTPLHYLKKRSLWEKHVAGMAQGFSIRRMARWLGIQVDTAFRWRHRRAGALCSIPQPVLTGPVGLTEALIPYSEKGSRTTGGPGAWRLHLARPNRLAQSSRPGQPNHPGQRQKRFRRLIQGKPTHVLLASGGEGHVEGYVIEATGQGYPTAAKLRSCLQSVLGPGAQVWIAGLAPFAQACLDLGVLHQDGWVRSGGVSYPDSRANGLRGQLYTWLRRFRGIATRYVENYLAWFRCGR